MRGYCYPAPANCLCHAVALHHTSQGRRHRDIGPWCGNSPTHWSPLSDIRHMITSSKADIRSRNHGPVSWARPGHQSHRQEPGQLCAACLRPRQWPGHPGTRHTWASVIRPRLSLWPDSDCGECAASPEPGLAPPVICCLMTEWSLCHKAGTCQKLDYNVIILQNLPRSPHPPDSDPWQFLSAGQDALYQRAQLRW